MISVIIPTYKNPDALDLCLRSAIEGQTQKNEIIVIVDGYYDINKKVLDKWPNNVYTIISEQNHGLCRSTNLGVYNASNERILIVNDDNVFPKNWDLRLLILPEKTNDGENIVWAPNQIEPIPSMFKQFLIENLGRDPIQFNLEAFWNYEKNIITEKFEGDCGSTLPIYMSKLNFLKIGGWNELYPSTGIVADWDFFLKCQLSNFQMKRVYSTHFYHFVSLSSITLEQQIEKQKQEIEAHNLARYIWGQPILHNPVTNLKYL